MSENKENWLAFIFGSILLTSPFWIPYYLRFFINIGILAGN